MGKLSVILTFVLLIFIGTIVFTNMSAKTGKAGETLVNDSKKDQSAGETSVNKVDDSINYR